jgi:hypothetical protein
MAVGGDPASPHAILRSVPAVREFAKRTTSTNKPSQTEQEAAVLRDRGRYGECPAAAPRHAVDPDYRQSVLRPGPSDILLRSCRLCRCRVFIQMPVTILVRGVLRFALSITAQGGTNNRAGHSRAYGRIPNV